MWDILIKFFEYAPLYVALVLVPAIIRTFIDTVIIKIPASAFMLPPSDKKQLTVKYEDAFASVVGTALYAPLVEEMVFRGAPYIFLGFPGLVIGNFIWVLAHPSWQLKYLSGMPTKTKLAFTANTIFYYSCAAIFFSIPWIEGYGILSVIYHIFHNGFIVLGGIFSEVELPAPWKKEESEFFKESRGVKKQLEKRFFRDTNPPKEEINVDELDIEIGNEKFFREVSGVKPRTEVKKKPAQVKARKATPKAAASVNEEMWRFWL